MTTDEIRFILTILLSVACLWVIIMLWVEMWHEYRKKKRRRDWL